MSCANEKNCKSNCNDLGKFESHACTCKKCQNEKQEFYLGLDDVTIYQGKRDDMKVIENTRRYFTRKFQKDPRRTVELAYFNQMEDDGCTCDDCRRTIRVHSYNPEAISDFWKKVKYDAKQKTYVYEEYLTLGTCQPPKQCQLECFYRGEYEFIKIRHEIQVLKTELVKA